MEMEGINEEIKIGIFGGNKTEKMEWLKHENNFFASNILKENELSEDTISNPNFKITINYQNSTIILIPFIEHKIDGTDEPERTDRTASITPNYRCPGIAVNKCAKQMGKKPPDPGTN